MAERQGSVLIVDDEPAMRRSLGALLEGCFTVRVAESLAEARQELAAHPIDVLLCDYELSDGNGLDLFQWVSTHFPQMMAILITGQPDRPELRAAEHSDAIVRVLAKPFDPARMVGLVERTVKLVRLRQAMQALAQQQADHRRPGSAAVPVNPPIPE